MTLQDYAIQKESSIYMLHRGLHGPDGADTAKPVPKPTYSDHMLESVLTAWINNNLKASVPFLIRCCHPAHAQALSAGGGKGKYTQYLDDDLYESLKNGIVLGQLLEACTGYRPLRPPVRSKQPFVCTNNIAEVLKQLNEELKKDPKRCLSPHTWNHPRAFNTPQDTFYSGSGLTPSRRQCGALP